MPKLPAVSVIIPVYNISPYIEKCARSLFEQTLESLEILFINDQSPDNSVDIINKVLEEYPHRQLQTKIITMPSNSGLSSVRKHGILQSSGEYVIHCDGDDWVDPDLYENLYTEANENFSDIVICDFKYENSNSSYLKKIKLHTFSGKELIQDWYSNTYHLSCCNKLVKRELYIKNNILPWDGLNMWEDNGLFARLFYHADNISQIHGPVYHYNRTNVNAITSGYGINQVNEMIQIAQNLSVFFESKPDAEYFRNTINAFKYLARINLITDSFKNYRRFLKTFPESKNIAKVLDPKAFSSKGRLRFNMVKMGCGPLFIFMFKLLKLANIK